MGGIYLEDEAHWQVVAGGRVGGTGGGKWVEKLRKIDGIE